jgi:hypothetical protein
VANAAGFQKIDLIHALWLIERVVAIMWFDYKTHVSLTVSSNCMFHNISNFQLLVDVSIVIFMVYSKKLSAVVNVSMICK